MVRLASLLSFHRDGETIQVKVTEAAVASGSGGDGRPKGISRLNKRLSFNREIRGDRDARQGLAGIYISYI
jgi:hypothetical protein